MREISSGALLSVGESHNAAWRLELAGLTLPSERVPALPALVPFLVHGVPHAYPATVGGDAPGVRTAFIPTAGGQADDDLTSAEFVWPSAGTKWRGQALVPLHPRAADLSGTNPALAELLFLVDLLRVGGAREREAAAAELRRRLSPVTR